MANVYSVQLWNVPATPVGGISSPAVPAGFVWVVRWITVSTPGNPFTRDPGWVIKDHTNTVICGQPLGWGAGGSVHQEESRQVIPAGGNMVFSSTNSAYSILVSGYQLTLP